MPDLDVVLRGKIDVGEALVGIDVNNVDKKDLSTVVARTEN